MVAPLAAAATTCLGCRRALGLFPRSFRGVTHVSRSTRAATPRPLFFCNQSNASPKSKTEKPLFVYNIAASCISKTQPFNPTIDVINFHPHTRKPEFTAAQKRHQEQLQEQQSQLSHQAQQQRKKRHDPGADSFFVSPVGASGAVAFGVTDGVGGWASYKIDPGTVSRKMCIYMAQEARQFSSEDVSAANASVSTVRADGESVVKQPPPQSATGPTAAVAAPLSARALMQRGYDLVSRDTEVIAGSTTACVAVASPSGMLEVANLGDSGYIGLRSNAVAVYSVPQTHAHNTPFQLTVVSAELRRRSAAFGRGLLSDLPRDADVSAVRVQHGDVLVLASDGVWDNLFKDHILRIVSRSMTRAGAWIDGPRGVTVASCFDTLTNNGYSDAAPDSDATTRPENGARRSTLQGSLVAEITLAAKQASLNSKVPGPFAKQMELYAPQEKWEGGKMDDIVVLVVVVSENGKESLSGDVRQNTV